MKTCGNNGWLLIKKKNKTEDEKVNIFSLFIYYLLFFQQSDESAILVAYSNDNQPSQQINMQCSWQNGWCMCNTVYNKSFTGMKHTDESKNLSCVQSSCHELFQPCKKKRKQIEENKQGDVSINQS